MLCMISSSQSIILKETTKAQNKASSCYSECVHTLTSDGSIPSVGAAGRISAISAVSDTVFISNTPQVDQVDGPSALTKSSTRECSGVCKVERNQ